MDLNVREMQVAEIPRIVSYFHDGEAAYMRAMGVYVPALIPRAQWQAQLEADMAKPMATREFLYTIWEQDDQPIGHCNVNKLVYGNHAYMHLHMWSQPKRRQGFGVELVRRSVRIFFERLALQTLFCEPYALNPAPNKTLPKVGFRYLYTHETTPGPFNFHQPVARWVYRRNP